MTCIQKKTCRSVLISKTQSIINSFVKKKSATSRHGIGVPFHRFSFSEVNDRSRLSAASNGGGEDIVNPFTGVHDWS